MSKRNSYEVSPNFSQYLTFQNQVLSGFQNFEGSGGMGPPGNIPSFDEFVNNQINNIYNKRRNTQKMNRNYFNSIFKKNGTQNQELINNFENRKKSNSQIYPKGYQINYNNNINQFNNNFFMNQQFSGNNIEDININNQKEIIIPDNNLNEQNKIEPNDFLFPINEYNEVVRKKSNSLALKNNTMFEQNNQINFPYKQNNNNNNNNNNFFQSHSKNNQKNHKFSSHSNNDLYIFKKSNSSIYLICQDQSKCRNIQDQLEQNKNDIQYIQNFFEQIKPNLINIMTHQFGNYVIQKFLEILIYQENKQLFTEVISLLHQNNSLFKISINNYGTRVVQKTLEKLIESGYNKVETVELNNCIKKLIEEHLYDLCRDKNGNHVYQKLLKVFHSETEENNNFLYDYLASISVDVAFLQQGATISQRLLASEAIIKKKKFVIK
jgi:hypothetical protein